MYVCMCNVYTVVILMKYTHIYIEYYARPLNLNQLPTQCQITKFLLYIYSTG